MKKIFYFLVVCILISCEKQEINSNENLESKLRNPGPSCTIRPINSNPFTQQSITFDLNGYSCDDHPNDSCFDPDITDYLSNELDDQLNQPSVLFVPQLVSTQTTTVTLSDVIDSSDLYPYISSIKANIVYTEIICRIMSYINSLPPLSNGIHYRVNITYLNTDFNLCCGGPEDAFTEVTYEVWKH